jgi:hypothetical protein
MRPAFSARTVISVLLLASTAGLASAGPAADAGPPSRIGHYSTVNGLAGFVLDRLGTPVKLRMDGSDEILALAAEYGSGDAVSLRRDDGWSILRIDDRGDLTMFTEAFRHGVRVIRDQVAQPLAIAPATKANAEDKAALLGRQLTLQNRTALEISLEAPTLGKDSGAWSAMADAITAVGIALQDVLSDALGRDAVAAKLRRVVIRHSGRVAISLTNQTLVVEIAADKPIIGRPSSVRLRSAMDDLL